MNSKTLRDALFALFLLAFGIVLFVLALGRAMIVSPGSKVTALVLTALAYGSISSGGRLGWTAILGWPPAVSLMSRKWIRAFSAVFFFLVGSCAVAVTLYLGTHLFEAEIPVFAGSLMLTAPLLLGTLLLISTFRLILGLIRDWKPRTILDKSRRILKRVPPYAATAFLLWSCSLRPADFSKDLRAHNYGVDAYLYIAGLDFSFYVFALLGCVLLWSLRPLTETRSTLIGWSIAMVYPSIGIVAEIYYQYFYYPTAAPFDRLFWPGIAYQFLIGGSGGALAGILRWISIDPIRNRLVTQGRAAYRAILWWLALLPMSALLIHILAAIRVVPYWFYYTTSSLDVLLFGALLTGWVAGTRAAKPTQRAWFSAGGLSLLSIALVISKHPTPLNLLFVWVVWNLGLNASTKVFETSPERRTTAAEKAVFIFSVPSIFLPALLFIPIAGFLIFYFGTGLFYLSSLLALLIAVFALMSKIPLWPKIANLLLAASSISFSFLLSEALRRVF